MPRGHRGSRTRLIELIEKYKPTLVLFLNEYVPKLVPILRNMYLTFRGSRVETPAFGLPKDTLRQIVSILPPIEIIRRFETNAGNREFLLVVVLTDSNKFLDWFSFEQFRNWDLWILDLCQDSELGKLVDAEIKVEGFITKTLLFSGLKEEIVNSDYKYISYFDDDLEASVKSINELFLIGAKNNFCLFQPALSTNSELSHENLRVVHTSAGFRSVPIVEIMCPFMRLDLYEQVADLSILAPSGWGFDIAISNTVLTNFYANPIVVDKPTVTHSRKSDPKNGKFYKYLSKNGVRPQLDLLRINHFLGISSEDIIKRNISNINDFKNPTLESNSSFNWDEIVQKGPNAKIAILMTKNEADILTLWVSHHIDFFDLLVVMDDSSIDGSRQFLLENDFKNKILLFSRNDDYGYIQREITTWLARYISLNAPNAIIFPLDTDEFLSEALIKGEVQLKPKDDFWWYRWKIAIPVDNSDHEYTQEDFFLAESRDFSMPKIVIRSKLILDGFEIAQGNHNLEIPGAKNSSHSLVAVQIPELIHIPVRSEDQFQFKLTQGAGTLNATPTLASNEGFHWRGISKEMQRSQDKIDLHDLSSNYLRLANSKVVSRAIIRMSGSDKKLTNKWRIFFKNLALISD